MAKKPKKDWSSVGRASKDKGKRFERAIAALLSDVSGEDWQRSRNSGRTDIPGDVYRVDEPSYPVVVECKNRVSWSLKDRIKANAAYHKNLQEVLNTANLLDSRFRVLNVLCKDEAGVWVAQWRLNLDKTPRPVEQSRSPYASDLPVLRDGLFVDWVLIGTTTILERRLYDWFFSR